jgi:Ca-activated chloride channel homolog
VVRRAKLGILIVCSALYASDLAAADEDGSAVDANIVTGIDFSRSINAQESKLQIYGMVQAIRTPEFLRAIQNGPNGRVGFAVFLWASGTFPELVSWRAIGSRQDAEQASAEILLRLQLILDTSRHSVGSLTNISAAIAHAGDMLADSPYASKRAIVNIVGNGEDNVGEGPQRSRDALVARGATINGVVIGGDKKVSEYYRQEVIGGPTAFVLAADTPDGMVKAFTSKFVSEITLNERCKHSADRM